VTEFIKAGWLIMISIAQIGKLAPGLAKHICNTSNI